MESILNFSDPIEYLNAYLENKKSKNSLWSMRSWSKKLGISPSLLSRILTKNKTLDLKNFKRILPALELSYYEKLFFMTLLRRDKFKSLMLILLEEQKKYGDDEVLNPSWQSYIFKELFRHNLINEEDFEENFWWSPSKEEYDLFMSENVSDSSSGKLYHFYKDNVKPKIKVRELHKGLISLALKASDQLGIDERHLRSSIFGFSSENYQKAVQIINSAHMELMALEENQGQIDSVFVFASQFLPAHNIKKVEQENRQCL